MPTKPLDRLMFAQGNLCFFCKKTLPKSEASVEHLLASANGGVNSDENCVACCKAVNALLGSMSLKEKFQVMLNQKGQFNCPNGTSTSNAVAKPESTRKIAAAPKQNEDRLAMVIANLQQRGTSKPRKLKTLTSTIASILPKDFPEEDLTALIRELQAMGKISISENKVAYTL